VGIHQETLHRETVLQVLDEAVDALQHDEPDIRLGACDALGIGTTEWAACRDAMIEELQEAGEWAEREEAIVEAVDEAPPVDSDAGPEFLPSHPTLALVQSAMDEHLETRPGRAFHRHDPQWLSVLYQRLRTRVRGKAPFVEHTAPDDFRFPLAERASVALVGDWGSGNAHAIAVAAQIRARRPDHVVHLGDVYYAGTPGEMRRNFLDVWRAHGPGSARYWSLNGNHDMYSGGHGYFGLVLPAFGQPASYFALANRHWQLIALDSAYVNHNFTKAQMTWLESQLASPGKPVLLTHHHLFSGFRKRGYALEDWLDPHLAGGRLFGWFWGHEHHLVEYADYRGTKCRCIGHGSVPHRPPDRRTLRHPVEIVRMETRLAPNSTSHGMHGFALLTLDGPVLHVEYIDEQGGTAWTERWE
jgi:hypothetical protein